MTAEYPARPPFFALRFIRLLTKSAAAMDIGADGLALLAVIACQEDACRYMRPVSFWNTQLATLMGLRGADEHALRRVRERCMKAGWLQYLPGNKQQPARYYVTIPAAVTSLPDGSSDESPQEYRANTAPIPQEKRQESGENPAGIRQESAENPAPSSPSPSPAPIPKDNKGSAPPRQGRGHVASNPPTLSEVEAYVAEIDGRIQADEFLDANTRAGWLYGKGKGRPVLDWKAHYRTWNRKRNTANPAWPTTERPDAAAVAELAAETARLRAAGQIK